MTHLYSGLSADSVAQTAASIAAVQLPSGAIPWFPDGQIDPWDHVEAAMGLEAAGLHDNARHAYEWLRATQNPDGSWYRAYRGAGGRGAGRAEVSVDDRITESNFTAYLAVGLLHHTLATGDDAFLRGMWPTLAAAIDFVLELQLPGGQIRWARSPDGTPADESLLTGCSSMFHSLRCALALAELRGEPQPDWELAATTLGHAVAAHPERFSPRERYSMDWYYPVLGGALRGTLATQRIAASWESFVVPGLGVRCVNDRPWVTGAETCELALALCAIDDPARAARLLADMQHLRHDDGSYWTGHVFPDEATAAPGPGCGVRWPEERTTWTAAAVLLASAMLAGDPATTVVFSGHALPVSPDEIAAACDDCSTNLGAAPGASP
jgi:hypothetical protein